MSCWTFLGIEPTEDEGEIKRVYLEMLPLYHPEEDPDGFRKLRMALEEALREAQRLKQERENGDSGFCESEMLGRGEIQDFLKRRKKSIRIMNAAYVRRSGKMFFLCRFVRTWRARERQGGPFLDF